MGIASHHAGPLTLADRAEHVEVRSGSTESHLMYIAGPAPPPPLPSSSAAPQDYYLDGTRPTLRGNTTDPTNDGGGEAKPLLHSQLPHVAVSGNRSAATLCLCAWRGGGAVPMMIAPAHQRRSARGFRHPRRRRRGRWVSR